MKMKSERYVACGLVIAHAVLAGACAFAALASCFHLKGVGMPVSSYGLHIQSAFYLFPIIPSVVGIVFVRSAIRGTLSASRLATILIVESLALALVILMLALPYTAITYSVSA